MADWCIWNIIWATLSCLVIYKMKIRKILRHWDGNVCLRSWTVNNNHKCVCIRPQTDRLKLHISSNGQIINSRKKKKNANNLKMKQKFSILDLCNLSFQIRQVQVKEHSIHTQASSTNNKQSKWRCKALQNKFAILHNCHPHYQLSAFGCQGRQTGCHIVITFNWTILRLP